MFFGWNEGCALIEIKRANLILSVQRFMSSGDRLCRRTVVPKAPGAEYRMLSR